MSSLVGRTLSHYRIVEQIGAGGMGVVYRARDERLGRDVAIKVLPDAFASSADRLQRFTTEARAAGALSHPNVLTVHDVGVHEGAPYLVAELLEGRTLREALEAGSLTSRKAAEVGAQIARGLAAAHAKGIVHRDLKPDNLFITTDGVVKILDFGLAKLVQPDAGDTPATQATTTPPETVSGVALGTVGYMAPEQVRGQPSDQRADIFAFGCVLYEMLTGRRAFKGGTSADTMSAILSQDPPPMDATGRDVPRALQRLVTRCLEKLPDDRFANGHELLMALQIGMASEDEVNAVPPDTTRRDRTSRRWPLLAGLAAVALIALALVGRRLLAPAASGGRTGDPPRIVILPFENLGPAEDEYFADGITEEITSRLASVSGVQVISRTSAMQYKENRPALAQIGRELDVGYVLEGTIRWDRGAAGHDRVRVTPQLIEVANDSHLWSERYDRTLEDVFAVQSDIAEQVIARLRARLLESERRAVERRPTDNMEAYQYYLRAIEQTWGGVDEDHQRRAAELLERAIALDPEFALAHAGLSEVHSTLFHYFYDRTPERLEAAKRSAERALELEPNLPEGHLALGWYFYMGYRDYERAREEFIAAAAGLPNDPEVPFGLFVLARRQGQWDEAKREIGTAVRLDPRNDAFLVEAGMLYTWLRDYEKAESVVMQAIAVAPDSVDAYWAGVELYVRWDGATRRARRLLESAHGLHSPYLEYHSVMLDLYDRKPESALARIEASPNDAFSFPMALYPASLLGCRCLRAMGEDSRAEAACTKALARLQSEVEAHPQDYRLHIALGHTLARLGRSEEAVRAAERAATLLPASTDVILARIYAFQLAEIYAEAGRHERALALIDDLLSKPSPLSVGLLRLDPMWDPLRTEPGYQALLAKYEVAR